MNKWIVLISVIIIAAIIAALTFLYINGFFTIPMKNDAPEFYNELIYAMLSRVRV